MPAAPLPSHSLAQAVERRTQLHQDLHQDLQAQRATAKALTAALADRADRLLTPALVIDLDAAAHNIAAMIRGCGGPDRWRPHIKTIKQRELLVRVFSAGVRAIKCATPLELELALESAAAMDITVDALVAYPHRGANLRELLRLRAQHPRSTVHLLANDPDHLAELARHAVDAGSPLSVFLDVDLGMRRTGTAPRTWLACLGELAFAQPGIGLAGLHGYDGHHKAEHVDEARRGYAALCELAEAFPDPAALELVTSGTHSYAFALADPNLQAGPWRHTVSAGTVVLNDTRSHHTAAELGLRQAAFVLSRVISGKLHRATLDAGSKAITPDAHGPSCRLLGYPEARPQRASEEHLPVEFGDEAEFDQRLLAGAPLQRPPLGACVWLVPDHVCTTVNLYRHAVYIAEGVYAGTGEIAAASRRPWAGPDQSELA